MPTQDGPYTPEMKFARQGYLFEFAVTYGGGSDWYSQGYPEEINGDLKGWEMRRQIKEWAIKNGHHDHIIYRSRAYVADLRGDAVYELYVKTPPTPLSEKEKEFFRKIGREALSTKV